MPGVFRYFQSLPVELQLMVWEEFLRCIDKRRIVLLNAKPVSEPDDDDYGEWDWSWSLKLDNREQLIADPSSVVAQSLLALCSSSRNVATRLLDATRLSQSTAPTLHLARDVFWIPDDLMRYVDTIWDSTFVPDCDQPPVAFHINHDIEQFEDSITEWFDLHAIKYAMISLDTFEQALLWADPSSESCGGVDSEICLGQLMAEFWGLPNLVVMVDVPRGQVSWNQLQVVDIDDAALYEMGAKGGPDRCLSAFQNYQALSRRDQGLDDTGRGILPEDFGDEMSERGVDHEPSHHVQVDDEESDDEESEDGASNDRESLIWPWWESKAPKLTFAFLKA